MRTYARDVIPAMIASDNGKTKAMAMRWRKKQKKGLDKRSKQSSETVPNQAKAKPSAPKKTMTKPAE